MEELDWLLDWFEKNEKNAFYRSCAKISNAQLTELRNKLIDLSKKIENEYPDYANRLSVLKDNITLKNPNYVNINTFGRLYEALIFIKHLLQNEKFNKWGYVHPAIIDSVRKRYSYGFYRDSVFAATNILISRLKSIIKSIENQELNLDGADLIGKLFSEKDTKIYFSEIDTIKGRDTQKGYVNLFRGWLSAIRIETPILKTMISMMFLLLGRLL